MNGFMGLVWLIAFLFAIPDVNIALSDPNQYVLVYVFKQCLPDTGITVLISIGIVLTLGGNISLNTSCARQTYAFARDRGLPFSNWISHVSRPLFQLETQMKCSQHVDKPKAAGSFKRHLAVYGPFNCH